MSGDEAPELVTLEATEILRTWGRSANRSGPKPVTFRRVQVTTVVERTERYCSGCAKYVPLSGWGQHKPAWCVECTQRRGRAGNTPARRERMRWNAHRLRAAEVGAQHDISLEAWRALVGSWGGCAVPGCDGPFERVDHITSFTAGGDNVASNLQPLCRTHDAEKTRAERAANASDLWASAAPSKEAV